MTESLPEAELLATRAAVEEWLEGHRPCPDGADALTASNLTLWARAFLSVTAVEAAACEAALKRQGALEFARRVLGVAAAALVAAGAYDSSALAAAFVSELAQTEGGVW